jgi:hypothetical protein
VRFRALLLVAALTGCDSSVDDGARAYREGRFKDAAAAFTKATTDAGDGAPAELLYDESLAALRAGDFTHAESSADKAASRGGAEFAALRNFVHGNAAFARSALSEKQADGIEAEPFAFDVAIAQATAARDAWVRAAVSRDDWPEARRNVERALLAIERLKAKKQAREDRAKKSAEAPKPRPLPTPKADPKNGKETTAELQSAELPADEVRRLFEVLAAKEKEKLAARRARRDAQPSDVEKDW